MTYIYDLKMIIKDIEQLCEILFHSQSNDLIHNRLESHCDAYWETMNKSCSGCILREVDHDRGCFCEHFKINDLKKAFLAEHREIVINKTINNDHKKPKTII